MDDPWNSSPATAEQIVSMFEKHPVSLAFRRENHILSSETADFEDQSITPFSSQT